MKKNRILIVSSDEPYAISLSEALSRHPDLEICSIAKDGAQAIDLVRNTQPDIVLTDLLLPGLDGLCMIKQLCSMPDAPIVICQSDFHSRDSIEAVCRSGASHFIFKPISPNALAIILREYASIRRGHLAQTIAQRESSDYDLNRLHVHRIMDSLGFSSKYAGSGYITESILLALRTPTVLHNMSSGLYRPLSESMHTTPECIERSIRTAIAATNSDGHLTRQIGNVPTNKTCLQYLLKMARSNL